MKTILTLLLIGAFCVSGRAGTDAMLCGIRIVETQDQPNPPRGKLGERGPYQFRRSTWRMHTTSSFDLAENREVANTVAKRHYAWLQDQLRAKGIEPTPFNVAMAWNAGVNAVIRGRVPAVARDYAARVINIASTLPSKAAEPIAVVKEEPKPVWRAPILMVAETSTSQESNAISSPVVASPSVPEPGLVATSAAAADIPDAAIVALAEAADPEISVAVRYHANPILLAFNRNTAGESAPGKALDPEFSVAANTLPGIEIADNSVRM